MLKLNDKYLLDITQDFGADNPVEWENLGTFLTWENQYSSPNQNDYSSPEEFVNEFLGEDKWEEIHDKHDNTIDFVNDIQKHFDRKGYIVYPISKFEHTEVKYFIGVGSGFDSGVVGFAIVSKDEVRKIYNTKQVSKDKVKKDFEQSLELYTDYANGYVFGFTLMDMNQNEIDSCLGFYGFDHNTNGLMETVNESLEHETKLEDWEQAQEKVTVKYY